MGFPALKKIIYVLILVQKWYRSIVFLASATLMLVSGYWLYKKHLVTLKKKSHSKSHLVAQNLSQKPIHLQHKFLQCPRSKETQSKEKGQNGVK